MTSTTDAKPKILLVEDDPDGRRSVCEALLESGYDVVSADCGLKGLELFAREAFDVVLSDIRLPDIDGMEVLKKIRASGSGSPVLLMTAFGAVSAAVEALRAGAYDYILKPLDLADLRSKLAHAVEAQNLRRQVTELKQELFARPIVARSKQMLAIMDQVKAIAPARANALILGESGTGKELVARALHALGRNPSGPFVAVNCGAFAESILESELFGHEKGAFTGADRAHSGAFERADNGTLFLDEIGLASPRVQSRLLRVLEERELMRVGGSKPVAVTARIVAASNRDLDDLAAEKIFRRDLLYRLKVITISIPPLRERREDIRPLAEYFIERACRENGRRMESIDGSFFEALEKHAWPGNVRELRNVVESAVVLATKPKLTADDLKLPAPEAAKAVPANGRSDPPGQEPQRDTIPPHQSGRTFADIERNAILNALRRNNGSRTLAARELDISTRTIQRKIKDYNLPF